MGSYGQRCGVRQKRPAIIRCLIGLGLGAVVVVTAGAAQKPPKLQDTRAMTTFRCIAGEGLGSGSCQDPFDPPLPPGVDVDRVRDDGNAYGYELARIASSGFYGLSLSNSGRSLSLALGNPIGTVPCVDAGNCNPDRVTIVNNHLTLAPASIELKPLVTATGPELSGLLWGMNCTDVYQAKVHYTFTLPSGDGHWGFNFNQLVYPGSNNALITRASDGRHWTVESNGLYGELLSWGHSGLLRRNSGPSHEGFFLANFKFTIEVVSLPSPSVGCP